MNEHFVITYANFFIKKKNQQEDSSNYNLQNRKINHANLQSQFTKNIIMNE